MARQPKSNTANEGPQLLRTVRFDNGDLYGPGEEEEFLERVDQEVKERVKARKENPDLPELSKDDIIRRLTQVGHAVGFQEYDEEDDEFEHSDPDLRVRQQYKRDPALIEEHPRNGGRSARGGTSRTQALRGPTQDEDVPEGAGGEHLEGEEVEETERPRPRSRSARKRAAATDEE